MWTVHGGSVAGRLREQNARDAHEVDHNENELQHTSIMRFVSEKCPSKEEGCNSTDSEERKLRNESVCKRSGIPDRDQRASPANIPMLRVLFREGEHGTIVWPP